MPEAGATPVAAPEASAASEAPERPPGVIAITLDGREVEARQGELVIEAAERAGVYIPRFCYHPRMKPVGMCRMCLVEISSPRGPSLQPACFVQVADGQQVDTASPAARKAQEGVLEFLLINHPLDCPVCDKGGECPLQDQAVSNGPAESRFVEEKRHWAKPIELGPLTLLDRERCIQCARCTRFAEELAGEPMIDFFERGDRTEVAIFPREPFTSYFSGNTVQICPVGALTSVPYRFKSRPWDLEQVETTCTFCAVGCRVAAQSSAGDVVRLLGIDSDPVNQSWLCDRGRYGYESTAAADRLREPLVRRNGDLTPTTWHEALRDAAAGLRQARSERGAQSIGIIGGARLANEDAYAWSKLARAVIGTDNVDAQLGDGLPARVVLGLPRATIDQAVTAKAVVLLAGDLREELPVLHLRLRAAAVHDGLRLIECAPVRTALADVAAVSVSFRPGEEAVLARALTGARGSVEVPGASPDRLAAAHDLLGSALSESPDGTGVVVVVGRSSVAESGDHTAAAALALAEAWPGARFLPALRRANVHGALDMGLTPGVLPGRVALESGRGWFEEQWGCSLPAETGLDTRGMLEAAAAGELGALVLLGADPLGGFPDRDLATRALEAVPFLVAVDTMPNPSVQLADVVLPAAGYLERGGTTTNLEGRVSRLAAKVVPPGTARADWVLAAEIAERLGADLGFDSLGGLWDEVERTSPLHRGCTTAALSARGNGDGIVVPVETVPIALGARRIDPMATPGISSVPEQGAPLVAGATVPAGETMAEALAEASGNGVAPALPAAGAGASSAAAPAPASSPAPLSLGDVRLEPAESPRPAGYSLRLVTRRSLYDHGTLVQAASSLGPLAPPQVLRLRPKEAEQLGVTDGDEVRVLSPRGELRLPVVADPAVPPGVAVLPLSAGPVDEVGAEGLIDSSSPVVDVRVETVS